MKTTQHIYMCIALVLLLCMSCDDPTPSTYTDETINAEFLDQASQSSTMLSSGLANIFKMIYLQSELNGFVGDETIENRQNCPNSNLFSDGVYPDSLYIKFDNCNPSFIFQQQFNGNLLFILNGPLDDPTTCPLFSVQNAPGWHDFVLDPGNQFVDAYNFAIQNPINFCLNNATGSSITFDYELSGPIIVGENFSYTNSTIYPKGMKGTSTIKSIENDDLNDPTSLLDNTFCISAEPTQITCNSRRYGTLTDICVATDAVGLTFEFVCGCPRSGTLFVDQTGNACSGAVSNSNNAYDFGYSPGATSIDKCDNKATTPNGAVFNFNCGF